MKFEQQLISNTIEKIAMLDADVKIRGRKGSTFPSLNGEKHNERSDNPIWIQTNNDYEKELSLRIYNDKEIKICLMLD